MRLLESGEMYLETILILSQKMELVRAIDVGEYMGYSKPSVSRALSNLREGGYVTVDSDGHLSLTESGLDIANKIYERHRVLSTLLTQIGVPEDIAAGDACKIEHDLSDETIQCLMRHLEQYGIKTDEQ